MKVLEGFDEDVEGNERLDMARLLERHINQTTGNVPQGHYDKQSRNERRVLLDDIPRTTPRRRNT